MTIPAPLDPLPPVWRVPTALTPLLGREQEVGALCKLLARPHMRLLTLVGPGGIGKTRLALQVAAEMRAHFAQGVCFVSLAPLSDPNLILPTIAQELGCRGPAEITVGEQVKRYLQDKAFLLILDNFEHLLAAASLVEELLLTCPSVTILATSRAVLHVQGEQEYPVPPLALPHLNQVAESDDLSAYAAIKLFLHRARAVSPSFELTADNRRTIAKICIRLDGLPLAIELAAARVKVLSSQALFARLSQRLLVLTGGPRTAPSRQQTLRNTLAWSYDLLDEQEQRLFRSLAIFVGGCSLRVAEAFCESFQAPSPLDGISSLFDKSLLQRIDQGGEEEPHLGMLETLREYGLELLHTHGEYEQARRVHARSLFQLAKEAEPYLRMGAEHLLWHRRLVRERENLRAALYWFIEQQDVEEALRLSNTVALCWSRLGYLGEARRLVEAALRLPWKPEQSRVRAAALARAGDIVWRQGDFAGGQALLEESVVVYRILKQAPELASTLAVLGRLLCDRGDISTGVARLEEGIELARKTGDQHLLGSLIGIYGRVKRRLGDFQDSSTLLEQSAALLRGRADVNHTVLFWNLGETLLALGAWKRAQTSFQESLRLIEEGSDPLFRCAALLGLGDVALAQGNWSEAESSYLQSLSFAQSIDHAPDLANTQLALAHLKRCQGDLVQAALLTEESQRVIAEQGDPELVSLQFLIRGEIERERGELLQATTLLEQGLSFAQSKGYRPIIGWLLVGLASVAVAATMPLRAARLLGLTEIVGEQTAARDQQRQKEYEDTMRNVEELLGEKAFTTAKAEGRSMSLDQFLAGEELSTPAPPLPLPDPPENAPTQAFPGDLTKREVEVLRLLAQGLTDAQIADKLVMSKRTVNFHLTSIYRKIQVSSRSAATRYALEHGLG